MNAAVQIFAYDEPPGSLTRVFESIDRQEVPEEWSVETQLWVTPAGPADSSFAVARRYGVTAYSTPGGKLSARNEAHSRAVEDGFDAIVALDADAPLLRSDSLQALLDPLSDPGTVAANSQPVAARTPDGSVSPFGAVIDVAGVGEDVVFAHLHGQLSAFTASAWKAAGPFDTSVDETDVAQVREEEEFRFYRRLRQVGDIRSTGATVYNDPRRHVCRAAPSLAPDGYCERRGTATFQPDSPEN